MISQERNNGVDELTPLRNNRRRLIASNTQRSLDNNSVAMPLSRALSARVQQQQQQQHVEVMHSNRANASPTPVLRSYSGGFDTALHGSLCTTNTTASQAGRAGEGESGGKGVEMTVPHMSTDHAPSPVYPHQSILSEPLSPTTSVRQRRISPSGNNRAFIPTNSNSSTHGKTDGLFDGERKAPGNTVSFSSTSLRGTRVSPSTASTPSLLDDADMAAGNGRSLSPSSYASSPSFEGTAGLPTIPIVTSSNPSMSTGSSNGVGSGILSSIEGKLTKSRQQTSQQTLYNRDRSSLSWNALKRSASPTSTLSYSKIDQGSRKKHGKRMLVLGIDISHFSTQSQFITCAGGVFLFSLVYGFLQELISVTIFSRRLGLFLAFTQFTGYTIWSYIFREYVERRYYLEGMTGEVGGVFDGNGNVRRIAMTRLPPLRQDTSEVGRGDGEGGKGNIYASKDETNLLLKGDWQPSDEEIMRREKPGYYNKRGVVTSSLTPSSSYLSLSELDSAPTSNNSSASGASNDLLTDLDEQDEDAYTDENIGHNAGDVGVTSSARFGDFANSSSSVAKKGRSRSHASIPTKMYFGLSILRAIDLGMTNLAMQYVNYPAKTLMKSSRVVWTMLFGVLIAQRRYRRQDYVVVILMMIGLSLFMHADARSSAVFNWAGILMLATALMCDGAISNVSEALMKDYNVGQDEYIFRLYSIATVAIAIAAALKGDLVKGLDFVSKPGTLEEIEKGQVPTYQPITKLFILITFASTGFFGSSCAAAITKEFGALTMSITSTARKATTLFFSFAFFPNECTWEHICGIVIFISSLIVKSLKKKKKKGMKEINKSSSNCDRAGKMRRWMRFLRKEDQFKKRDSDPFLVLPLAGIRTNGQQIHHTQQRQQVLSNVI